MTVRKIVAAMHGWKMEKLSLGSNITYINLQESVLAINFTGCTMPI